MTLSSQIKRLKDGVTNKINLDSSKSSAKDLSQPMFAIMIIHITFNGESGSYATGSKPIFCLLTMDAVDNTA
jgi:hypothetical protein